MNRQEVIDDTLQELHETARKCKEFAEELTEGDCISYITHLSQRLKSQASKLRLLATLLETLDSLENIDFGK